MDYYILIYLKKLFNLYYLVTFNNCKGIFTYKFFYK